MSPSEGHVAALGGGLIGRSWTALFLAAGRSVRVHDPDPTAEARVHATVEAAWPVLAELGLVRGEPGSLAFCADAREAVEGAVFVQESIPERVSLKHELYAAIEPVLAPDAIVASSASGLTLGELQPGWRDPGRLVLGHPFNPPHLIPLVEVMGNERTAPGVVRRARDFYESVGKVTIEVRREVPGHVANRLQAALWREAIHLVNEGVASVEDVDTAVSSGPGLRWAVMGPSLLFHLGGDDGGLATFCERYADSFNRWWDDLGTPRLDPATARRLVAGLSSGADTDSIGDLVARRDRLLTQVVAATHAPTQDRGSPVATPTQPPYQVTDPSTGEVLESFDHAGDDDIDAAITASAAAYTTWRDVPIADRAVVVKKVAALFAERADELAEIARQEMGKPLSEGVEEAEFCQAIFDYFADEGPGLVADQEIKTQGGTAKVQRLPIGPLLGIMPWNFPYYQIARFAAPNLMLGNTIILKHAESVPRSALAVEQIMKDAGIPEGAYVNVFATFDQVETIIADPRIQGVSLTGSERAGSVVASLAGKHLKKCVLELGGSDPMIVLDTDDLDELVGNAWDYRTYNTGQACNSNKRMIVHEDVYDDFVAKIVAKAQAIDEFSPLSSRRAAETLAEQVDDAVSKGATLHAGGVLGEGPAAFYSPAVLTGITKEMRAYAEELFGPVAVVYKVGSDEEAITLANDTSYGLGGSVFSKDVARAEKLAQRLEVGMANVNTTAGEGAEIPFGGVKRSGFGRELGPLGMDEFVNKRLYYVSD